MGMKFHIYLIYMLAFVMISCNSDNDELGVSLQPAGDNIVLKVDSFGVTSQNIAIPSINSRPDSLLFGTFVNAEYGTLNADILTQVMPPINAKFPAGSQGDSAKIIVRYLTWFGDNYSPFSLNAYQMDLNTFDEKGVYYSNIKPEEYCTKSILLGTKVATASDYGASRNDTSSIEIKLSDNFVKSFEGELTKQYTYETENDFHQNFKGIYLTTNFGTATMLNVRSLLLRYYYSYKYVGKNVKGDKDSTYTVNLYQDYPASKEIRMVNRLMHKNKDAVLQSFNAKPEINLVSSPSNIYTTLTLPYNQFKTKLQAGVGNKKLLLNRAMFRVYVDSYSTENLAVPLVSTMMMINEDSIGKYFNSRNVPSAYSAVVSSISYEAIDTDSVRYYYDFDMSKLLTEELNNNHYTVNGVTKDINFRLVPVSASYNSSGYVKEYKEMQMLRAVKLCSPNHPKTPMKLRAVYSGF